MRITDSTVAARLDQLADRCALRFDGARAVAKARLFSRRVSHDGVRIAGRYVVGRVLGRGAFGVVCLAHDLELDRPVALKLLHGDRGSDATVGRHDVLAAEARALARVSHPNVVAVFDVGVSEGRTYLAMECVPGFNLRRFFSEKHPPSHRLRLLLQAGLGLVAAHEAGIVHRDFKPENVLVGLDGRVRVVDFGLARSVGGLPTAEDGQELAPHERGRASRLAGTPAYMAPELLYGHAADRRSDQYAFFVAAYEAAYGSRPHQAPSIEALRLLASHSLRRPRVTPDVPARLFAVLVTGLQPDPDRRYPDMRTALAAVEAALAPHRRTAMWMGIAAVTLAGVGLLASRPTAMHGDSAERCESEASALAHVWTDDRRRDVWRATISNGRPHAIAAWPRVEDRVDRFVAAWKREHTVTCRAPTTSTATLDCLARRRAELDTVLAVLEQRGSERCSAEVLRLLGSPSRCRDASGGAGIEIEDFAAIVHQAAQVGESVCRYARGEAAIMDAKALAKAADAHPASSSAAWLLLAAALDQRHGGDAAVAAYEQAYSRADPNDTHNRVAAASALAIVRAQVDIADAVRWVGEARSLAERSDALEERCLAANAVARVTVETADYRRAEQTALEAIEICGRDSVEAADLYGVLAEVTSQQQRLVEGRRWAQLRVELEGRNWGREDPRYAIAELGLGVMAPGTDVDSAKGSLMHAVTLLARTLGSHHAITVWARSKLALAELEAGNVERARDLLEAAWAIEQQRPARDAASRRLHYLNALAQVYSGLGEHERALEMHQRSVDHALEWLGEHPLLGAALSNTGAALRRMGRYDEAVARFGQAIDVMERLLGPSTPLLAYPVAGRAHALGDLGREREALHEYERALAIVSAGDDEIATALIAAHVAVRLPEDDRQRARGLAARALTVLRMHGTRHARTIAGLERLVEDR